MKRLAGCFLAMRASTHIDFMRASTYKARADYSRIEVIMSNGTKKPSIATLGGIARAASMTKQQRSESAKKAASARWKGSLPRATHGDADHPLCIAGVEIPCFVLEDGRRVISQRGLQLAVGMNRSGGAQRLLKLVGSFSSKSIDCRGLSSRIENPIKFITPTGSIVAHGYEATALTDLCDVILDARKAGVLRPQQVHLAEACEILVRSFAKLGIIALVDEVTGYQHVRANDELQQILARYISKELARWVHTFEPQFYEQMYRLRGWDRDHTSSKKPSCVAKFTIDLVYDRIHPDLLKELKSNRMEWEQSGGKKGGKLHQFLTSSAGHTRLKQHLEGLTMIMRFSKSWEEMEERVDLAYPKINRTMRIPFPDVDDSPAAK